MSLVRIQLIAVAIVCLSLVMTDAMHEAIRYALTDRPEQQIAAIALALFLACGFVRTSATAMIGASRAGIANAPGFVGLAARYVPEMLSLLLLIILVGTTLYVGLWSGEPDSQILWLAVTAFVSAWALSVAAPYAQFEAHRYSHYGTAIAGVLAFFAAAYWVSLESLPYLLVLTPAVVLAIVALTMPWLQDDGAPDRPSRFLRYAVSVWFLVMVAVVVIIVAALVWFPVIWPLSSGNPVPGAGLRLAALAVGTVLMIPLLNGLVDLFNNNLIDMRAGTSGLYKWMVHRLNLLPLFALLAASLVLAILIDEFKRQGGLSQFDYEGTLNGVAIMLVIGFVPLGFFRADTFAYLRRQFRTRVRGIDQPAPPQAALPVAAQKAIATLALLARPSPTHQRNLAIALLAAPALSIPFFPVLGDAVAARTTLVTGFDQAVGVVGIALLWCGVASVLFYLPAFLGSARGWPTITGLFLFAVLLSAFGLNDNHNLYNAGRLECIDSGYLGPTEPGVIGCPVNLAADTEGVRRGESLDISDWLESRRDYDEYENYPIFLVATEGGGLRAAYFTGSVLGAIQDLCPAFSDHVLAVSAVSGGSLGASAFAATVQGTNSDPVFDHSVPPDPFATRAQRAAQRAAPLPEIKSAQFDAADGRIVTAGGMEALVWNLADGSNIRLLSNATDRVVPTIVPRTPNRGARSAAFSRDGKWVLATFEDSAHIAPASGGVSKIIRPAKAVLFVAAFSPDASIVATISADSETAVTGADAVQLWSRSGHERQALIGHSAMVRTVEFSPDGAKILTAGHDGARIWDTKTGAQLLVLGKKDTWTAKFSSDGALAVTASDDGTTQIWDVRTGTKRATLTGRAAPATSPTGEPTRPAKIYEAAFSRDGKRVFARSDSDLSVWNVDGRELFRIKPKDEAGAYFRFAEFSPDGKYILTVDGNAASGSGKGASVWDVAAGERTGKAEAPTKRLAGHTSAINSAVFSHDSTRVLTASDDGRASIWPLRGRGPSNGGGCAFGEKHDHRTIAQNTFNTDLLSPLLARALFPDALQRITPFPLTTWDRATSLEHTLGSSWKHAAKPCVGCDQDQFSKPLVNLTKNRNLGGGAPDLFLNTTEVETGRPRAIATRRLTFGLGAYNKSVVSGRAGFAKSQSAYTLNDEAIDISDLELATAATLSARFPYVTPAGSLQHVSGWQRRYVDGGYFENSGTWLVRNILQTIVTDAVGEQKGGRNFLQDIVSDSLGRQRRAKSNEQAKRDKLLKARIHILLIQSSPRDPAEDCIMGSKLYNVITTYKKSSTSAVAETRAMLDPKVQSDCGGIQWQSKAMGELLSPLRGLINVRSARASISKIELEDSVNSLNNLLRGLLTPAADDGAADDFITIHPVSIDALEKATESTLPLTWVLSKHARDLIDDGVNRLRKEAVYLVSDGPEADADPNDPTQPGTFISTRAHPYCMYYCSTEFSYKSVAFAKDPISPANDIVAFPDRGFLMTLGGSSLGSLVTDIGSTNGAAALSPGGEFVATADTQSVVRLWDYAKAREDSGAYRSPSSSPFTTEHRKGELANTGTGRPAGTNDTATTAVTALAISRNGQRVAVGEEYGSIRILNLKPAGERDVDPSKNFQTQPAPTLVGYGPVTALDMSEDGQWVVAATQWSSTAQIFNAGRGERERELVRQDTSEQQNDLTSTSSVTFASFSRNTADLVIVAYSDGSACIFRVSDGEFDKCLRDKVNKSDKAHAAEIKSAVFSVDSTKVLTASIDGTIKVWDAETGDREQELAAGQVVWHAAFSDDAKRIVASVGYVPGYAQVWERLEGKAFNDQKRRRLAATPMRQLICALHRTKAMARHLDAASPTTEQCAIHPSR